MVTLSANMGKLPFYNGGNIKSWHGQVIMLKMGGNHCEISKHGHIGW